MTTRFGTTGDDILGAAQASDTLVGLEGNDTYDFGGVGATVVEESGGGTDTIRSTFGLMLPEFVENFILVGGAGSLITGNALANRLEGGVSGDTLDGAGGIDTLVGGGGGDIYLIDDSRVVVIEGVGAGDDEVRTSVNYVLAANVEIGFLNAGSAATTLTGNLLANQLSGNELANVLDGAAGDDIIVGDNGNDTLRGGDGNDLFSGDAGNDVIDGGNGNDTMFGIDGDDRLTGGAGNDLLAGGLGRDTLDGGAGNDTYELTADDALDVIVEAASGGIDTVRIDADALAYTAGAGIEEVRVMSGSFAFILTGNAGANTLVASNGDDRIDGLAGNDAIDGGLGADTMLGGLGNDQYSVDDVGDQVIEVAGAGSGSDRVFSSIASYVLPANVERLMLVGQTAVTGVGNALDNTIDGNAADNRLEGGAGNDWLDGRVGADTVVGGTGNDTFVVDNAADAIVELSTGGLADLVRVAADITYTMADGVESALVVAPRAHVIGNRGANTITGGAGNDELDGGRGIDRLVGGTGDDSYVVDDTLDVVVEVAGAGIDTVFAGKNYTLVTNVERLVLLGSAGAINGTGSGGNDTITGNGSVNVLLGLSGNDELYGMGGNDNLQGGLGNDLLDGGTGVNALSGGTGDDTFVVRSNGDTIADDGGRDLLVSHLNQVELLSFLGSPAIEDILLAEGASVRNAFGNTLANTITGNLQQNLIDGNAGNDFIDGAAGVDTLRGGAGDDTMRVSDVGDLVVENPDAGTDTIRLGFANYTLPTNVENLIFEGVGTAGQLVGNTQANAITGGSDNDSINGGAGADTMTGGAGNDAYALDNVGDRVVELVGGGIDSIAVSVNNAGPAVLTVNLIAASGVGVIGALNVENVIILGTGLYNITGSAANNILTGNASVNIMVGGAGNDELNGGGGADSMAGGTGDDTYYIGTGDGALGGQQPSDDIITELANGGRDVAIVTATGDYLLPDFVEDLQGTVTATRTWTGNALVNAIDVTLVAGGADTIIAPGLGANDSVIVRGLTSGKLTVTDTDGTDFVQLVLSGGTSTLDLDTGVNDVRFELLSGTSAETVSFAANATVLVTGAGSLTLAGTIVANQVSGLASAYSLDDFTGTLTFGATAVGASDAIALTLNDVQGALATSNTAIERFDLDSQGPVANSLAIGGVSLPVSGLPGFSVTGETALDLTAIGTSLDVLLDGFSGSRLGLAAAATGSVQAWTVRADGSATDLAITAGGDANTLAINTTGTGGESLLALSGESVAGAITLSGNQGLTLLGVSGGTVASTMTGAGVVLRAVFDGATDFTVTSGAVDTELTGSSGADSFVFGSSLDSNDMVDGGAGSDDLSATLAATVGVEVTAVSLNIASVEAVALNVQGRYLLDADAMDASVVTVTGGAGTENNDPTLQVDNGSGVWNASAYTRRFTFTAAADADGVTVTGGTKVDVITGSAGDDIIDGKGGTGGTETGGEGADTFRFTTAPTGLVPRAITDFVSGTDRLELANEVMAALGVDGALNPALFVSYSGASAGTDALSGAGVLKYVTTTGTLYYDADGNGAGFALHLTTLSLNSGAAALAATDFTVI